MAFDDVLRDNLGVLGSYITTSIQLWAAAAVQARSAGGYPAANFWTDLQKQFLNNWNTWEQLTNFSGYPTVPTAYVRDAYGNLGGQSLSPVYAGQSLANVGMAVAFTDAVDATGTNTIPSNDFGYTISGDLRGVITIDLNANPPAAGVYRGMALVDPAGGQSYEPLAEILIVAL